MSTHVEVNHDSGGTVSSHYDTVSDGDSALSITGASALDSTANGFQQDVENPNIWTVIKNTSAPGSNEFRFRFRFKSDQLANFPGSNHGPSSFIWRVELRGSSASDNLARIQLAWNSSGQLVWSYSKRYGADGEVTFIFPVGDTIIDNSEHCMEVRTVKETADGNNDGELEIFLDTVSQFNSAIQENFNTFAALNQIRILGNSGTQSVGLTGDAYLDEFILDDDDQASLGCIAGPFSGYDLVLGGGQP